MSCVSIIHLVDDGSEGNNQATVRCQLAEGHLANIDATSQN